MKTKAAIKTMAKLKLRIEPLGRAENQLAREEKVYTERGRLCGDLDQS
jgi:FtsZ-binding cell division protein ZapB